VFGGLFPFGVQNYPLEFICIPLLIWAAFRFTQRETATIACGLSAVAIWGTLHGFGPFFRDTPNESLVLLQVFMGLVAVMSLVLATTVSEHKRVEAALERARNESELRVQERTVSLSKANEALKTFAARLERSNRELQEFASVASHDLQEPLRKVRAFGDLLQAEYATALDAEGRDYLERMQGAASRMQTLINDMLMLARLESEARPFVAIDLNRIARNVLADLEVQIARSGARVELGDLPIIEADPLQMRQLLQNVIGNALKFYRPQESPVVKIRSRSIAGYLPGLAGNTAGHRYCQISVEDNGIGFDERYLDRIFAVFQRLHGRGEYEGTGIGLAICRRIVERHSGNITATSAPGQGATFIITLPVEQASGRNGS
jgi:light-regulated signal transduction histidine kinase (bacteriophytochrome)